MSFGTTGIVILRSFTIPISSRNRPGLARCGTRAATESAVPARRESRLVSTRPPHTILRSDGGLQGSCREGQPKSSKTQRRCPTRRPVGSARCGATATARACVSCRVAATVGQFCEAASSVTPDSAARLPIAWRSGTARISGPHGLGLRSTYLAFRRSGETSMEQGPN